MSKSAYNFIDGTWSKPETTACYFHNDEGQCMFWERKISAKEKLMDFISKAIMLFVG